MNKWTRANPLAAVPGYKVPRGHYANGYTNGGDRVGFRKGGTVGLKKGGRTKRQAAASEIFKAKGLEKAGKIGPGWGHPLNPGRIIASGMSTNFSGYPEKSKYEKSLEKHKKKFPTLVENIKYGKKKDFKKVKPSPQKRADGGRIELKRGGSPKNWIQKAVNPKHKGFCTPMTKKTCTPRRKALARTFKKMGKARKGK